MNSIPSLSAKQAEIILLEFVRQNLVECSGTAHITEWVILNARRVVEKLMTIEAI